MISYQTHAHKLPGSTYREVYKHASVVFSKLKRRTKRQPYIRSAYFNKQKVFLNLFWKHLFNKPFKVRTERLKFFMAGVDLIVNSRNIPETKENIKDKNEVFHRFMGLTKEKEQFAVQIKEEKRSGKKYLMSIFPYK